MIFYTATDETGRTHWVGTQADARAIDRGFQQADVPTGKPGLLAFLNEMQARLDAKTELVVADAHEPTPIAELAPAPNALPLDEQIMELEGSALLNALAAAIDRLHETAGREAGAPSPDARSIGQAAPPPPTEVWGLLLLAGLAS